MAYAEEQTVEAGLRFTSPGGISVETTGNTVHVVTKDLYVHEVIIVEGVGEGRKYLLNLDAAKAV